jgi:hypothetical protein
MAKKVEEETMDNFTIDSSEVESFSKAQNVNTNSPQPPVQKGRVSVASRERDTDNLINCLENKIVTVQFIPQGNRFSDPKHVLYGGMAERSTFTVTVPKLRSGTFKNVLTDAEKDFLEAAMGLEVGALNVYNKHDNFWSNSTEGGISKVRLNKDGNRLNLADPVDYIKYKILLANKDLIASSMQELRDRPKATYRFVLISDTDTTIDAKNKRTTKTRCYTEYGKIEDKADVLKTVIETITGKPLAANTKLDFLQNRAWELIEEDPRIFLSVVQDPLLSTKVLIYKCIDAGLISKKVNYLYLRSDNTPLCEGGEEPVLSVAARYLNSPKRQELKLSLEAKLKQ